MWMIDLKESGSLPLIEVYSIVLEKDALDLV